MYLPQTEIIAGEELKIHYLAPGGERVSLRLCRYSPTLTNCLPKGSHPWVYMDIMNDVVLPSGQYFRKCDFIVDGEYLDSAIYYVVMCWNNEMQKFMQVNFTNE